MRDIENLIEEREMEKRDKKGKREIHNRESTREDNIAKNEKTQIVRDIENHIEEREIHTVRIPIGRGVYLQSSPQHLYTAI